MAVGTIQLTVHNPTGAIEKTRRHAPRLDTLADKTICELSNAQWGHDRILPAIREALTKQFPTARVLPYESVIHGRLDMEDLELVARRVKERGCQAVITGMAA